MRFPESEELRGRWEEEPNGRFLLSPSMGNEETLSPSQDVGSILRGN